MSALDELNDRTDLACQQEDPRIFFPEGPAAEVMRARAKRACAVCPARELCAQAAVELVDPHGVWAGVEHRAQWERPVAA